MQMQYLAEFLGVIATLLGARAAWLWYRASAILPVPTWITYNVPEPADREMHQMGEIVGLAQAMIASGELNQLAARWTAASVFLGAASNLAANWPL
jgi:hypothetical protein